MKKSKKNTKKLNQKALLDTSIFTEIIKYPSFEKQLYSDVANNRVYSSHFVLYEYKVGLILCLIELYSATELLQDLSKAIVKISDKWGRDPKTGLIFLGVMLRINKTIDNSDYKKTLRQIEFCILYIIEKFYKSINGLIGSFAGDQITKFKINSAEDFSIFSKMYKERDTIPQTNFWATHKNELQKLLQSKNIESKYPVMYARLLKIDQDFSNADKYKRVNRGVGDFIIGIDMPNKYILYTLDKSFEHICGALNKKQIRLSKS